MKKTWLVIMLAAVLVTSGCNWFQKKTDEEELYTAKEKLIRDINQNYDNPEAHYQLGKIYQGEGLYDKAQWEFNIALQQDPVLYKAQSAKVKSHVQLGEAERAKMAAELYISQAAGSAKASSPSTYPKAAPPRVRVARWERPRAR